MKGLVIVVAAVMASLPASVFAQPPGTTHAPLAHEPHRIQTTDLLMKRKTGQPLCCKTGQFYLLVTPPECWEQIELSGFRVNKLSGSAAARPGRA